MEIEKVKKRDRERTNSKILRAVGQVIEQHRTEKVGVNLISDLTSEIGIKCKLLIHSA